MNPIITDSNFHEPSIRNLSSLPLKTTTSGNVDPTIVSTNLNQAGEIAKRTTKNLSSLRPTQDCPLTQKEIQDDSVLLTLDIQELPIPPEEINKLLGNFLGGGLVTGGRDKGFEMDGFQTIYNFQIWENLLESLINHVSPSEKKELENILKGIKQLLSVSIDIYGLIKKIREYRGDYYNKELGDSLKNLAFNYTRKIENLKKGESFSFPGGWSGYTDASGHAIIYEISRNDNNTFDMFIYTSTNFPLADNLITGDKVRLKPLVRYANIPEQVICFNNDKELASPFIISMIEVTELGKLHPFRAQFNQEDVLQLFDHLEKYRVSVPYSETDAITGQRAGTCAVQSTKAWLRKQCSSQSFYKQVIFQSELRLLVAGYRSLANILSEDSQNAALSRNILKQTARNSLRRLAKVINPGREGGNLINENLAKAANATAYDILQRINVIEEEIKCRRLAVSAKTDISQHDSSEQREVRRKERDKIQPNVTDDHQEPIISIQIDSINDIHKPSDLTSAINSLKLNINKFTGNNKYSTTDCKKIIALEINKIVDQLPIPKCVMNNESEWIKKLQNDFWNDLTKDEAEEAIRAIHELADLCRQFPTSEEPTRTFANALTFQTLTHLLAIKIDNFYTPPSSPLRLENFKVPNPGKLIEKFDYIIFVDRNEFLRIRDSIEYFTKFNSFAKEDPIFTDENNTRIYENEVVNNSTNKTMGIDRYWSLLLDSSNKSLKTSLKDFSQPQEDTSVPINEKLVLELGVLRNKDHPLNTDRYRYILYLRNMLSWSDDWIKGLTPRDLETTSINENKEIKKIGTVKMQPGSEEFLNWELAISNNQTRKLSQEHNSRFPLSKGNSSTRSSQEQAQEFTKRNIDAAQKRTGEFRLLDGQPTNIDLIDKLMRTTSEWKLTPYQLISECSNEMERFRDPSFQSLFFRLFLRAPVHTKTTLNIVETKSHLGIGELILNDPALVEICVQFIEKGLFYFSNIKSNEGIKGNRFFLELSYYLYKYLKDAKKDDEAKKFDQISAINRMLQNPQLNPASKSTLHSYRLLFFSTELDHLNDDQIIECYQSRALSRMHIDNNRWNNNLLNNLEDNFIYKLGSKIQDRLSSNASFRNQLGASVLKSRLSDSDLSIQLWTYNASQPNLISGDGPKGEKYQIDFLTGKVYKNYDCISKEADSYSFELDPNFIRMFGKMRFDYEKEGENIYKFEHPTFGNFKITNIKGHFIYERQFRGNDDLWYELSTQSLNKVQSVFDDDHLYWIPKSNQIELQNDIIITGYYTTLNDQKRCFASLKNGKIITVDSNLGLPTNPMEYLDLLYLSSDKSEEQDLERNFEGLLNIDTGSHIIVKSDEQNKTKKISYPRLNSINGNPLEFSIDSNNRLIWSENNQYIVASQIPKGYLGAISNYLLLEPKSKSDTSKILVPFQPIENKKNPIPEEKIMISNREPLTTPKLSGPLPEQKGRYHYYTYDLVNGDLKPTSTEAQLYLAYIYYSQKDYERTADLIRKVNKNTTLSADSIKILEMIETFSSGEHLPNGHAIKFLAFLLKSRQMDKGTESVKTYYPDKTEEQTQLIEKYFKSVTGYTRSINNVSIGCRLNEQEEKEVLIKLLNEFDVYEPLFKQFLDTSDLNKLYIAKVATTLRLKYIINKTEPRMQIPIDTVDNAPRKKPDVQERLYRKTHDSDTEISDSDTEKVVNFLNDGYPINFIHKDPSIWSIAGYGKICIEVYRIAKGNSISEKNAMIYKLNQWRLDFLAFNVVTPPPRIIFCYLHILLYPDLYKSEPIDPSTATPLEMYKFLQGIEKTYTDNFNLPLDYRNFISSTENLPVKPLQKEDVIIPKKSEFDIEEVPLNKYGDKKIPVEIDLSEDPERWKTMDNWKTQYLKELEKTTSSPSDFNLHFNKEMIKSGEESYAEALTQDLTSLQREFDAGKEQMEQEASYTISKEDAERLKQEALDKIDELEKSIKSKKRILIEKVNQYSKDKTLREYQIAKVGGKVSNPLNYHDCMEMLLSMDAREYQRRNPNISDSDSFTELAQMTLEIEDLRSYKKQLKKIADVSNKISSMPDEPNDMKRYYLCQTLFSHLEAKYHFDSFNIEDQVALRVFSGQSGMVPQEKQTKLIAEMMMMKQTDPEKFQDIVIQLIMGGGKTSVIATIVLYLTARKEDKLAAFVVPQALFNAVTSNIGASMQKAFGKDITTVQFSREELTTYKLQQIRNAILDAKASHEPLVITASCCQSLELELLSQSRKLKSVIYQKKSLTDKKGKNNETIKSIERNLTSETLSENQKAELKDRLERLQVIDANLDKALTMQNQGIEESKEKIKILSELNQIIKGDALLDEVDLILDCLQEVNFPDGSSQPIQATHNNMLHAIFKLLIDDTLKIPTIDDKPSMAKFVGLNSNEQTLLDSKDFVRHVAPVIAEQLAKQVKEIQNNITGLEESYIRYASGKIPPQLQDLADDTTFIFNKDNLSKTVKNWENFGDYEELKKDFEFLKHLKSLYDSDKDKKEAANLIALSAHILCELVPATLNSSGKRNYGVSLNQDSSRIVPYLAVNTPATTQFGYYLEEACYYYQWAASFNIRETELKNIAASADAAARYYVERNNERYEETVEYQEFKRMFGIGLDEINKPEKIQEALELLSKDPIRRLDIAYELVSQNVANRSERLSSNGTNLMNQFQSRRTMSGTPWNVEGYVKSLLDRYKGDTGTEGKVLYTLAKRSIEGKVHVVDFETVDEFLDKTLLEHPKKAKVRGIIEAGGIFKKFPDNAAVAKSIMDYIDKNKISDEIEGVLFFYKASREGSFDPSTPSDTLYVWKKGAPNPEPIQGTSVEAIKAKGLDPTKYFVYYDERHTTGVDILQTPDAINLFTFDEKMIRRTVGQGIMRLRQYLYSQDVEIVVQDSTRPRLWQEGKTERDLIISAEKNQSIRKTKDMERYFRQQIDSIFRSYTVNDLVLSISEMDDELALATKIETYEPFFVTTMRTEPYLVHGKLKDEVDTKQMLISLLDTKFENFKKIISDQSIIDNVAKEVDEMRKHIRNATCLSKLSKGETSEIGLQQTVEVQVETQTEVETEVDLELKRYEMVPITEPREETKPTEKDLLDWIAHLQNNIPVDDPIPLKKQLKKYNYGILDEHVPYEDVFNEAIYGTGQFFYSCKGGDALPVFHRLQRPGKQILAVETTNGFKWLMLSEHEANAVKKHLYKLYHDKNKAVDRVWLIQPDGTLFADHAEHAKFPIDQESVKQGLLEINVFNGNADYLDRHTAELEPWIERDSALKIRFLKLRTARERRNHMIIRSNRVVINADKDAAIAPNRHTFKLRAEREKRFVNRK